MSANSDAIAATFYLDSAQRYVMNHTAAGGAITYTLTGSAFACNVHGTPNFDEDQGGVTSMKSQNIMQSDYITAGVSCGVQAEDILKVTNRDGSVEWLRVAGAAKTRRLIPHVRIYTTPCDEPLVA